MTKKKTPQTIEECNAELKAQTAAEYEELKAARSEVRELQQIRRCIDAAERCEQQEQAPSLKNQKKQNMEL